MKKLFRKLSNLFKFSKEDRLVNVGPDVPDVRGQEQEPDDSHIDALAPSEPIDESDKKSTREAEFKLAQARKRVEEGAKKLKEDEKKLTGKWEEELGEKGAEKLLAEQKAKEKKLFPWEDEEAVRQMKEERKERFEARIKAKETKTAKHEKLFPWESEAKVAKLGRELKQSQLKRTGVEYKELGPREIRKFEKKWMKTKKIPEGLVVYPPPSLQPGEELKPIEKAVRIKFDVNKALTDLRLNKRDRKLFEKYFLQDPLQEDLNRGILPENKIDNWLALPLKTRKSFTDTMRNLFDAHKDEELSDLVRDFDQSVFEEKADEEKTKELIAAYVPIEEGLDEVTAEEPQEEKPEKEEEKRVEWARPEPPKSSDFPE